MTDQLNLVLPTDLLWNKRNGSNYYPQILSRLDPERKFSKVSDIAGDVEYEEDGKIKTVVPSRKKHRLTNFNPVEALDDNRVKIGGLYLYEKTPAETYRMSAEGKKLRRLFHDGDNWSAFLSELLCKYFLRVRTLLHYLTVGGCTIRYSGHKDFYGDQALKSPDFTYTYYLSSAVKYDGAYTVQGLVEILQNTGIANSNILSDIRELYTVEYEAIASNFIKHREQLDQLERIRRRLHEQIDVEDSSESHLEDIHLEAKALLDDCDVGERPTFEYERAPNLLLGANIDEILGPFLREKTKAVLSRNIDSFDRIRVTAAQNKEPLGGNIINVTNWGLIQLLKTGVLSKVNTEDNAANEVQIDSTCTRSSLSEDVSNEILSGLDENGGHDILKQIQSVIREERDETGFVLWGNVRETVCKHLNLEEDEFTAQVRELMELNEITVVDKQEGIRMDPRGPPAYENYPRVKMEF